MKKRSEAARASADGVPARPTTGSKPHHSETDIAMLAAAITASPIDAIIGRTLDGTITSWNVGAQRLLGYSAAEAIGQPITITLPPDLHGHIEINTLRIIAGEAVAPYETRRIAKDGRVIDVLTTVSPIRNDAGEITGAAVILHDISALKRAEAALTESESWFSAAFEQAAVGMAVRRVGSSDTSRWLRVNQKLCDILGYTREELLQLTSIDHTPPEDRDDALANNERLLRGELTNYSREKRYLRKDGRIIWVNLTVSAICGPDGRPTHVISVIEDISDRKRAEQSRADLAAIVENAGDAIIGRTLDGTITSWNGAAERMFGYSSREVVGALISIIDPVTSKAFLETNETLRRGIPVPAREAVLAAKDGRTIDVSLGLFPVRDADGTVTSAALIIRDISPIKRAEAALKASQEMMRATFEQAAVGVVHTALDRRYLLVNQKFCDMLGYTRDELMAMSPSGITHPDDRVIGDALRDKLLAGELNDSSGEKRYIRKDGSVIWTNRTMALARDSAGNPLYFIRFVEDITNRKEAEDRFIATFEQAAVGIAHIAVGNFHILMANRKFCDLLGYARDELIGTDSRANSLPDDMPVRDAERAEILTGRITTSTCERQLLRKDGSLLWVNRSLSLVRDAAGQPKYYISVIEDIAERRKMDQALRESEARFRAIFDHAGVGITMRPAHDRHHPWTQVNDHFCKLLGYTREELLQLSTADITPRDEREKALDDNQRLLNGEIRNYAREKRILRKDGTIIWVILAVAALPGVDGRPRNLIAAYQDITARKQAQETQARLAAIVATSNDAIVSRGLDYKITSWNASAERLFGYTAAEAIGQDAFMLVPPERKEENVRNRALLAQGRAVFDLETIRLAKGGRRIEVSLSQSPIRDDGGAMAGVALVFRDISERKRAQEALARLAAIVENAQDAIIGRKLDGTITSWNAAAVRMFGYSANEAIGQSITIIVPPERHYVAEKHSRILLSGGHIPATDVVRVTKDGRSIDVTHTISPVRNEAGEITGASIIIRDITERKRAEETQARLAAIIASSQDAILSRDLDGRITSWNASAERLFGYTAQEAIGQFVTMLMPPERRHEYPSNSAFLERGETVAPYESERLTRDGRRISVSLSLSPMRGDSGQIIGTSAVFRDITERKRAEETQARLAAIVENANDAIIGRSLDGTITSWNAAAERIFGYSAAEAIGQSSTMLTPEPLRKLGENNVALRRGKALPARERMRVTKDGRTISVISSISPVRNEAGEVVSAAIITHDISELKQAERELQRKAELTQLMESLARAANEAATPEEALRACVARICNHGNWILGRVATFAPGQPKNTPRSSIWHCRQEALFEEFINLSNISDHIPREGKFVAAAIRERKPVWISDLSTTHGFGRIALASKFGIRAGFAFPVVVGRETLAVLEFFAGEAREPDTLLLDAIGGIGSQLARVIERQHALDEARASEQKLDGILGALHEVVWSMDLRSGRLLYLNAAAERLTRRPVNDFLARPRLWRSMVHREDRASVRAGIRTLMQEGRLTHEFRIALAGGEIRRVENRAHVVRDAHGAPLRIDGTVTDITERKRAEETQAQLAAIVENANDAIIGRSLDGIIISWNAAAERIFGYSAAEAVGQSVSFLARDPLPLLEANNEKLRRGIAIPARERMRLTKDGRTINVISSISPVRNEAGEVISSAIITHDVSELKQAQHELRQLNRELEERVTQRTADLAAVNRELEAFSYSVSHDLRAPLRAIGGFARLATDQRNIAVPPETRNFLERISRNVEHMNALIDELLAYSRLKRSELRRRPVVTAGMVRECLETLRAGEQDRSIELVVGELPDCEADSLLLGQVWMNLLSNAFKFTARCNPARIEIGSLGSPDGTVYFVRDNGAGFDMQYANKLFNVFQRLHHASEYAGHGIGLATVHNILLRHGGKIWAEAAPNQGATFFFTVGRATAKNGG